MSTNTEEKETAFYNNDVIYRFDENKEISFGIVVATFQSSYSDYSLPLREGQLRVNFGKSADPSKICSQKKVKLFSRCVIPDDIVRRIEQDKETQRGYCRSVKTLATVQIIGSNKIIENVDQERLKAVMPLYFGAPVSINGLVGRLSNFEHKVTMTSSCGSVVEFKSNVNCILSDEENFYVGQIIRTKANNLYKAKWLKQTKSFRTNALRTFIVEKVTPIEVSLEIFDFEGNSNVIKLPDDEVTDMQVLEIPEECVLLNESHLLKLSNSDMPITRADWLKKQTEKFWIENGENPIKKSSSAEKKSLWTSDYLRAKLKMGFNSPCDLEELKEECEEGENDWIEEEDDQQQQQEQEDDEQDKKPKVEDEMILRAKQLEMQIPVQTLCTETLSTIVWQDGTIETVTATEELHQSISLDDHEFFCGEFVVTADGDRNKYGAIQKVNYLSRTAVVKWFTVSSSDDTSEQKDSLVSEISVYDIKKHRSFAFRPSTVVQRIQENMCRDDLGYVIDCFPEGFVKVKWIDGSEEDCSPERLSILPNLLNEQSISDEDFDGDDEADEEDDERRHRHKDTESDSVSWDTESVDSTHEAIYDSVTFQNLFTRFEFIRQRICYIKDIMYSEHCQNGRKVDISCLTNLLKVYENLTYVDKILGTSHFSLKDPQYQSLLYRNQQLVNRYGIEINIDGLKPTLPPKLIDNCLLSNDNIMELFEKDLRENFLSQDSAAGCLCIELLTMFKQRLDSAFTDLIIRMDNEVVIVAISDMKVTPDLEEEAELQIEPSVSQELIIKPIQEEESPRLPTSMAKKFEILDEAPNTHQYYKSNFEPVNRKTFFKTVMRENKLLSDSLPEGVWVYSYANRMDLYTIMIRGPDMTPYEDGLFIFDLQLSTTYPDHPPHCTYISYNSERLNPNLYVEGKVCVSLLGTWTGHGTEVWRKSSTLLQLIVSIQGLILVAEPYYNEAGYEKQCKSQVGAENSRIYNELVLLRLVQSMTKLIENPYELLKKHIFNHFKRNGHKLIKRLSGWIKNDFDEGPQFPLLPVSEGLKLSLNACLNKFKTTLELCELSETNES